MSLDTINTESKLPGPPPRMQGRLYRWLLALWRYLSSMQKDTDIVVTSHAQTISGLGTLSTQDADSVEITGGAISGVDDPTDADGVGDRGFNDQRYTPKWQGWIQL